MNKRNIAGTLFTAFFIIIGIGYWTSGVKEKKTFVIGVINYSPAADKALEGFKLGMTNLGYIEGESVRYLYSGHISDKKELLKEGKRLLTQDIDLIYSMSTPATLVAKEITKNTDIPIVFAPVSSPIQAGIVRNMVNHEKGITGITFGPQEPRRLEMLAKLSPASKRVFVPYNPKDKSPRLGVQRLLPAAEKLGVTLVLEEIEDVDALIQSLDHLRTDIDAIFLPTDSFMVSQTNRFIDLAIKRQIPLTCPHREGVDEGALFSYGFSIREIGIQAARLADQIFKGVSAGELPVELGEFILSININTAKKIGLRIPENILRQARVIK